MNIRELFKKDKLDYHAVCTSAFKNRAQLSQSSSCGCYYCCKIYAPSDIEMWVDNEDEIGQTAMCPKCGIDSVIGSASGYPVTEEFLKKVHKRLF